jgi:hypothetical protein
MQGKLIGHVFVAMVLYSSGKQDNKTPLATVTFPDNERIYGRQENTAQIRDMYWENQ